MQQGGWFTVHASEEEGERLLRLTIDAGKGNVLTRACLHELREATVLLGKESRLRALVLDHAGEHFSYGASVAEHRQESVGAMLEELSTLALALLRSNLPLLAVVHGHCLGGGLELVLLADRVFASPSARFGQPEVSLGVFAPVGSALLPLRVGARAAADLLLSGRSIGAEEAHAIGLVAEIAADPRAAALTWAREHLMSKSTSALRLATRASRFTWFESFARDVRSMNSLYLDELLATPDAREGIEAFLEKRAPHWEER
jgi:cyclohexa-1,5-dienecarbonyl-CoA hydratase